MLPHREHDVEVDVDSTRLTDTERDAALERLKLYGRDPVDAEPIFTQEVRGPSGMPFPYFSATMLISNAPGNRNTHPPRLQQPLLHNLAECATLPGKCAPPPRLVARLIRRPTLRDEAMPAAQERQLRR